jgi:hypothetical protein
MRRQLIVAIGIAGTLCAVASAFAHHSFAAEFDANRPVALVGTVTKVEWTNPHSWIHLDVRTPNGTVEKWMIETGTPGTLVRRGLTKDALPIGTNIKITGYQALDGSRKANGNNVTLADGRTLDLASSLRTGPR